MDLYDEFSIFVATLGGLPYWLVAITLGSLYYLVVRYQVESRKQRILVFSIGAVLAMVITEQAAVITGSIDPSQILLDDLIAVPFIFLGYGLTRSFQDYGYILAGLIAYGFLDGIKPLGIDYLSNLPGGIGIVADDLGAALLAAGALYLIKNSWEKRPS